jgi:hypothetical protein
MILAKGGCPRAILARLAPIVIGSGLLAGCQAPGHVSPPEIRADAWRVIERVGEARYLSPGASSWSAALSATTLPDGSRVATGAGGRLILTRAGDHVTAGPGSEFSLPGGTSGAALEQTAGQLRYRLGGLRPFTIATPAAALEPRSSVFDVLVGASGTDVAVEDGQLRVGTPDRQREIELEAGQSAHAGGREALAFRRASGQPLEQVERIVLPAIEPKPTVPGGTPLGSLLTAAEVVTDEAATSAAAGIDSTVPAAATGLIAGAKGGDVAPVTRATPPGTTEANSATLGSLAPAPGRQVVDAKPPIAPARGAAPMPGGSSVIAASPGTHGGSTIAPAPGAAPMAGGSSVIGAVQNVPPIAPAAVVTPSTDGASAVAPAPDADASAQILDEGRGPVFDRLTEGMVDTLSPQPAPPAPSTQGRSN